jgi:hypothetical protein
MVVSLSVRKRFPTRKTFAAALVNPQTHDGVPGVTS